MKSLRLCDCGTGIVLHEGETKTCPCCGKTHTPDADLDDGVVYILQVKLDGWPYGDHDVYAVCSTMEEAVYLAVNHSREFADGKDYDYLVTPFEVDGDNGDMEDITDDVKVVKAQIEGANQ